MTSSFSRRQFLRLGAGVSIASFGAAIPAIGLFAPLAGARSARAQGAGVHINHGSIAINNSLDPHGALTNVGFQYARQVYDTLVNWNADGSAIEPALATAWTQIDDTTWELTLREGVVFHDGDPFNADAVVFNVERVLTPDQSRVLTLQRLATLAGAEAVDPLTVRITTTAPDPIFLNRLTMFFMVSPVTAAGDPAALAATANGTGYFRVVGYEPGNRIELEAFADGWRGLTDVTSASLIAIPDPAALLAAVQTGEVDLMYGAPNSQMAAGAERGDFGVVTQSAGSCAICSLLPDVNPALADVRVRQAISHAINREEFVEAVLAGYGEPADGQFLQPGFTGYNEAITGYAYDPDRARALLAEAGAADVQLNIATTILFRPQAEAIAGYLNAVGIRSEVEIQDFSVFLPTVLFQSAVPLLYWTVDYFQLRDFANIARFGPQPEGVQSHFPNAEYLALFAQANSETDPAAREATIQAMAQIMHDEAGALFIAWPRLPYAHSTATEPPPVAVDTAIYLWQVTKDA
jgi:peptide/nickel transport system substrate-binding protein